MVSDAKKPKPVNEWLFSGYEFLNNLKSKQMKVLIILGVIFLAIVAIFAIGCSLITKLHQDPTNPDVWHDDEGNEYTF